jgi:hypothetical protein
VAATDRVERRLAAILAADIVGYARLVEQDEAGTLAAIRDLRREAIDPLLAGHHGRIVKLMGDGGIVEFGSVVDAAEIPGSGARVGASPGRGGPPPFSWPSSWRAAAGGGSGRWHRRAPGRRSPCWHSTTCRAIRSRATWPTASPRTSSPSSRATRSSPCSPAGEWAFALNPVAPIYYHAMQARALYGAGEHEAAVKVTETCVDRRSCHRTCRAVRIAALGELGRMEQAKAEARELLAHTPGFNLRQASAGSGCSGDPETNRRLLSRLREAGLPEG